jgi:formylglycine-generating enzyme required for sulfatase activity
MLPVFLPLRELKDLKRGRDTFIQNQLNSPHLKTPQGFGKRLLLRGNLLLLLDGLDEVANEQQREQVAGWIRDALQLHPSCRFVVTSRFAGYIQKARLGEHFLEMHLRPLTEKQVEIFIHNWYKIVEKSLAKDPDQAEGIALEKADSLVERLREPDFRARRVFELTRNPLLLTNICLVHRHRGSLPRKRARLYEECIDVLLEHWRGAKGLSIGVTAQAGCRALQPAAYWLHSEEGRTRAKASELAPRIEPVLKDVKWTQGTTEDFLRTIRDESGLLTGWGIDNYGFMHLGFQEYLAAREIRSRACDEPQVLQELASHFGESWWQEVGLLLLALEDPSLFVPFMREVVKLPAFAKNPQFVEMCLDDAAETSPKPFEEILREDPGKSKKVWARQLVALRVLEQLKPDAVERLQTKLAQHPSADIRRWFQEKAAQEKLDVITADRGGYELIHILSGQFMMGSPESEEGRFSAESPLHEEQVTDFYLGRYPVTNEDYGRFLSENPDESEPEFWADRELNQPRQPVVGVSWEDALRYADWAGMRLPTEAEWEFACRAGTHTRFYTGDKEKDLDRAGWYRNNSQVQPHILPVRLPIAIYSLGNNSQAQSYPVGTKEPNAFGLYDMHGNVWEWVEDDWHDEYKRAPDDGSAWIDSPRGANRVIRGGSWDYYASGCRSAVRNSYEPAGRYRDVGFRLARFVALGP